MSHAPTRPPIRLLVVEDHPAVLAGLVALLQRDMECEVVGESHNRVRTLNLAVAQRPDVVVLDLMLQHEDGLAPSVSGDPIQLASEQ